MRVLAVEGDVSTRSAIELMLKAEGFNVSSTDLGEEAIDLLRLYDYDVCTLELTLPDMSGYEVVRTARAAGSHTPILILSGLASIEDKVKAFEAGADDYLTKPFHKSELVARLNALVRRSHGHSQPTVTVGAVTVNLGTKTATVRGADVHLTGKEYGLLEVLALRKGNTVTKEMILNHLYGGLDEPELKIIDVFVCKLRRKIADLNAGEHYIETVWGRGFMLRERPASEVSAYPVAAAEGVAA